MRALLAKLVKKDNVDKRKQLIVTAANESGFMIDGLEDEEDKYEQYTREEKIWVPMIDFIRKMPPRDFKPVLELYGEDE